MSYELNNFVDGSILTAMQLNKMDNQIAANEAAIDHNSGIMLERVDDQVIDGDNVFVSDLWYKRPVGAEILEAGLLMSKNSPENFNPSYIRYFVLDYESLNSPMIIQKTSFMKSQYPGIDSDVYCLRGRIANDTMIYARGFIRYRLGDEEKVLYSINMVYGKAGQLTKKTRIDYDGTNFKLNGVTLNYEKLYNIHLTNPDFAFVVYGDRAYLLSYVQDGPGMKEMRFQSTIAVTDSNGFSNVKTSGIYVTSTDGVNIASVRVADINSENNGYKVDEITDDNKDNAVLYPSVKAVSELVDQVSKSKADKSTVLVNDRRITNLEYASQGILYRSELDSNDAYRKTVPSDALPYALINHVGCKSVPLEQLVDAVDEIRTGDNVTITCTNRVYHISGLRDSNSSGRMRLNNRVRLTLGHKYFLQCRATRVGAEHTGTFYFCKYQTSGGSGYGNLAPATTIGKSLIHTCDEEGRQWVCLAMTTTAGLNYDIDMWVNIIDLTELEKGFGRELALDELEEMFYKPLPATDLAIRDFMPKHVESNGVVFFEEIVEKHFPNGMKSAGSVYDELDVENKVAIQRVGSVDLGSLDWTKRVDGIFSASLPGRKYSKTVSMLQTRYANGGNVVAYGGAANDKTLFYYWKSGETSTTGTIYIHDDDYATAEELKASLNGVYLYYELANEVVTGMDKSDVIIAENIEVTPNGEIVFDDGSGVHIPIPSEIEYLVKTTGGVA